MTKYQAPKIESLPITEDGSLMDESMPIDTTGARVVDEDDEVYAKPSPRAHSVWDD